MIPMIDFHAHILPGADHGSDCSATSLAQLARAEAVGVDTIVATPHFYYQRHTLDGFLKRRGAAYERLMQKKPPESIAILKGAEVTVASELPEMPGLEQLCIADTEYILLELPDSRGASWVYDTLYKIEANRGLKPIIAHVDRYPDHVRETLLEMDFLIQINAEALSTFRGGRTYRKLFQTGQAHLLGSDVHGAQAKEYTAFHHACKVLGDELQTIMQTAREVLSQKKQYMSTKKEGGAE